MKHCPYCKTDYESTEIKCPTCSAVEYEIKCDQCHTVHTSKTCPNCGYDSTVDNTTNNKTIGGAVGDIVSGVTCKISGHDWFGCKCRRCGEIRDENHSFTSVAGSSLERCSVCGKTRDVEALAKATEAKSKKTKKIWTIVFLIILPPVGILLTWLWMKDWDFKTKIIVSIASAILFIYAMSTRSSSALESKYEGEAQALYLCSIQKVNAIII